MQGDRGIVYILTNPLFKENVLKIGITKDDVKSRMRQWDRETGVPCPFECYVAYEIDHYAKVEKILHTIYRSFDRHTDKKHKKKEFFAVNPEDVDNVLSLLAEILNGKRIIINNSPDEIVQIEQTTEELEKNQIAKNFKFKDYGIPVDAELVFSKDNSIRCTVLDNNKVLYKNEEYSLSRLTLILMKNMGYSGNHYNGYAYWLYNDMILSDFRNQEHTEN